MTTSSLISLAKSIHTAATATLDRLCAPVLDLIVRVTIGLVFFRSGLQKLQDWESTIFLFADEYKVPLLAPELAATLGTFNELVMPLLLFVGLASRLAALPLMGMTLIIQFVLGGANPAFDKAEHFFWLILLATIVIRGPGKLSVDHLISRKFA